MKWYYWVLIAGILFLISKKSTIMAKTLKEIFVPFIKGEEGFSEYPYWDNRQWTWGYGTKVPGSSSSPNDKPIGRSITKAQAAIDAYLHAMADYEYFKDKITIDLNTNQWAAFLSFSYNLGRGNAHNLLYNINNLRWPELKVQWMKYFSPGLSEKVQNSLKIRRGKELDLFFSV